MYMTFPRYISRYQEVFCRLMFLLKMCIGDNLCYLEQDYIGLLLNQQSTRDLLGIPPAVGNFTSCSSAVGRSFAEHLDKWRLPAQFYVANLLERGIRILLYEGMHLQFVQVTCLRYCQVLTTGNAIGRPTGCGLTHCSGPVGMILGHSQCAIGLFPGSRQQPDRREARET